MTTKQLLCAAGAYSVIAALLTTAQLTRSSIEIHLTASQLLIAACAFWVATTALLAKAAIALRRR